MRAFSGWLMALCASAAAATAAGPAAGPPKVLLHVPFDGTPDAAFAANGRTTTSYLHAAYRPGVRAQGAQFGSDRYPCGLVLACGGLLDKAAGSIEFWYMPLWDPADPTQQPRMRTLASDELPANGPGHLWLLLDRGSLHFGIRGRRVLNIAAPIHRWRPETWHHVVAAWDREAGLRLFLDGEPAGQAEGRWAALPPSRTLYLGADRYGGHRAEGLFDELRLYDRALTATDAELAFINNLTSERAQQRPPPKPPEPPPAQPPRLAFHAPFDNVVEAQAASGNPRPITSRGAAFAPGLIGQALVADAGLDLAYHFAKNLSKDAGAISLWTRARPDRRPWRGVLLSDDLFAADPTREAPGTLAFWLQRQSAPRACFGLWPLRFQQPLPRWDDREWVHLAACWRRGERAVLYVNGLEAGRASDAQALWATEVPKLIHVGSIGGKLPAGALIDDLRFYTAPLSRDQVQAIASQFLLPLVLQLERSVFERGKAADLVPRFYNPTAAEVKARVALRVVGPDGAEVYRVDAPLEAPAGEWTRLRIPLSATALGTTGLYQLVTRCEGRVSCPRARFLVVAPEAAGTASARFQHTETIECAKQLTPGLFCQSGGARVVRGGLGAYVEAGAYPDARFAYRFRVARVGVPHVAVVVYPADRPRSAEIVMTSRRHPASRDVATGYFVGQAAAAEPKVLELPLYFWPRETENAIIFRTLFSGQPAACAKIIIRRLDGRLPPAAVEEPKAGGRTIGLHWDRPLVPLEFGATGHGPQEVYESFRRLADYLEFTGQNLLCYPVMWRMGLLYPAESEGFRLGAGADQHPDGWLEEVLHLCEQRGIKFLPEVVFDDAVALSNAFSAHTSDRVAKGLASARMVAWDDRLTRAEPGGLPRYNPLHPAVRAALLDRMTEVAERYGNSPALAGVSLYLGPGQSTWFGSIQCGYDDATVEAFAREADLELPPECRAGPTRFSERARWLLSTRYDRWVSFRCRKLRQLYVDLASRVQSRRPDLKLYLTVGMPDSTSWYPLMNLTACAVRPNSLDALYREAGLDISLYKQRPANLVLRRVVRPSDQRYLLYRYASGGPNPHPALARDLAFSAEASAPFAGFGRVAVAAALRPFESTIGALRPMRRFWWREHPSRLSHPVPAGRGFLEPLAHAVAALDALSLTVGGAAIGTAGHEDAVRDFARAYRALPAAPFATVGGMADPVCVRELHGPAGHFFYLVNRSRFPAEALVGFSGKEVRLRDFAAAADIAVPHEKDAEVPAALPKDFVSEHALADDEGPLPGEPDATQKFTGPLLRVKLEPFELRSYRIDTQAALIRYAAACAPAAARLRLAQRIESARDLVEHSNAPPDVVATAKATLELVARAWRKHELARVEALLESYPIARLR